MDDKQLEERLNLLKTSYDRVPSSIDTDGILNKIELEKVEPLSKNKTTKSKWQKITVLAVSIASILIIGILGATFLLEDETRHGKEIQNEESKAFLEKLKKNYPIEREKRREMLNLSEEEFSQIEFIRLADMHFQHYTDDRSSPLIDGTIYTDLDEPYEEIMNNLKLPSEMVNEIHLGKKLNKEETVDFLNEYYLKINSFREYANEKLNEYKDELAIYKVDGLYDVNKILENERYLPEGFENLRDNSQNQSLRLDIIEDGIDITFRFDYTLTPTLYFGKLNSIADGYLQMMASEPFTYTWELLNPINETFIVLKNMENYFLDDYVNTFRSDSKMESYYTSVFYFLVKGTKENPVFDKKGIVKDEYRELWRLMTQTNGNSPFPYLLIPIVNEFEKTGWTKSEEWNNFSYAHIEDALHLAKNGDIEKFMPNLITKDQVVNHDFLQQIHALYKSFAATHDQTVLKDATPEEIVGLYYYCSLMEDYETKYELYIKDDSYVQIPKEEYMSAPKLKITDIRKEFSSLHFEQRSDKEGYVIITMAPERTIHLEEQVVGFSIIQTENGWRAAFMPTQ
ncbi:hypothetical protein [Psychrobacillus sp. FJAT-21963]|uniref:hypothetical protein n=1 Tax=Psychrobacillus sp. FJAT-21963 TaxID=1712028 RepID=UPI0007011378|nr:hypothetical protein [Psychrobacillus sp. FJAT-21963]KQL33451.1 hypothetical protein AN959_18040 [Psychrobacillus sp. FJAT-21963]